MALGIPEPVIEAPPGGFFRSGGRLLAQRYRLRADFVAFQGHFPGQPILPALAQVLLARDSAEQLTGPAAIAAIIQAKFLSRVEPDASVTVFLMPPMDGNEVWLFQLFARADDAASDTEAARLKMRLVPIAFHDTEFK